MITAPKPTLDLLLAITFIAGSLWFVYFAIRMLWRRSAAFPWKIGLMLFLLAGTALGIKLAFDRDR